MLKKILLWLWASFFAGLLAIFLFFFAVSKGWVGYVPDMRELADPEYKFASQVFSADGVELGTGIVGYILHCDFLLVVIWFPKSPEGLSAGYHPALVGWDQWTLNISTQEFRNVAVSPSPKWRIRYSPQGSRHSGSPPHSFSMYWASRPLTISQ